MPTDALGRRAAVALPLPPNLRVRVSCCLVALWALLALSLCPGLPLPAGSDPERVRALLPSVTAAVASLACVRAAHRTSPRNRRSWQWAAIGSGLWAVGGVLRLQGVTTLWTTGTTTGTRAWTPHTIAVGVATAVTVLAAMALVMSAMTRRNPHSGLPSLQHQFLDGAVLALSSMAVGVAFAPAADALGAMAATVTACLIEAAAIGLAVLVLHSRQASRTTSALIAALATALLPGACLAWLVPSGESAATTIALLHSAGFMILAASAAVDHRSSARRTSLTAAWSLVLPPLTLVAALAATTLNWLFTERLRPIAGLTVMGAAVALLARHALTLRDNQSLIRQLAAGRDEAHRQAQHDPLTGQTSRSTFTRRLRRALARRPESHRAVAVLLCDIDGFAGLNDALGHTAGDQILTVVAHRLSSCLPEGCTLARLGGDEFAVLVQDLDPSMADDAARHLAAELRAAAGQPWRLGDAEIRVSLSIGIIVVPSGQRVPDVDAVLSHCDIALQTAKRAHRAAPVVYAEGLSLPEARDWQLRPAIERALREGTFEAHYQPVVDLRTGRINAVEALARWQQDGEVVPPEVFLPVMTRAGILTDLTDHMVRSAVGQLTSWGRDNPAADLRVTVNISPCQLVQPFVVELVGSALERSGLAPHRLILEITEESLLSDPDTAAGVIRALHGLGVQVWLDDFGTGYSSFALLHRLPLQAVKLDQSLIRTVDVDPALRHLVGALVALSGDLGLDVIAEGIQREEQARALRDLGCPLGQGFLFSPPLGGEAIRPLLGRDSTARKSCAAVGSVRVPAARSWHLT